MNLHVNPSKVSGRVAAPGSKSHTIRALVAGLLADGISTVRAPLESADTLSALAAIELMGAKVEKKRGEWLITGCGGKISDPGKTIDLGNSGTGLRLLSAVAATAGFEVRFDGDASLRTRPMGPLKDSLKQLGVAVSADHCPLKVKGPFEGGCATVDAVSSQFLSALLFAAPLAQHITTLELLRLNEVPYVGVTLAWLDRCGIDHAETSDYSYFIIPAHQSYRSFDAVIPADFSTACFPLAAAAIAGGEVKIANLDFADPQGDKEVFDMFSAMGADVARTAHGATIRPHGLRGTDIDLNRTPDALPVLAVAACFADGVTRILNVPQARLKETDRIACMTRELRKMGADIDELDDGMVIRGNAAKIHGAEVESYDDHRIAMSLAIAGLAANSPTTVRHAECCSVTYPGFVEDFRSLGADFRSEG
ncbi:MAG: 3-phosphoshikimate 1-carboxyvinyltransferase [Victivallaceae bacterium]|nr:3-phosphoshikimate 1-carboxyvinyltransferase [Victivallaceae bacterium]